MFTDAEIRRIEREDAARLKELGGEPAAAVQVNFLSHTLEPMEVEAELLGSKPDVADMLVNIICIPTGLHLVEGTHWHPTGEVQLVEVEEETRVVPVGRQVPNLVSAERAAEGIERKPSKVIAPPVDWGSNTTKEIMPSTEVEEPVSPVSAEEIAMARAEAKALRELDLTTESERRAWGGIASRRTDRRVDTSWLWPSR